MKNALQMINEMDDDMIRSALEEPTEKKTLLRAKNLRWLAAAACLAALIAIPVAAAAFSSFTLDFDAGKNAWSADTDGRFALEEYSEQVQSVKGQEYFPMQDLTAAEEFLGIDLPDNRFLEGLSPKFMDREYFSSGESTQVACDVYVGENEGNLLGTHTTAFYHNRNALVMVTYSTVCEQNPHENGGGFGFYVDGSNSESEKYVTPHGRECEIVTIHSEYEYDFQEKAFTVIDRALVVVEVYGSSQGIVRETITNILDAYN